MSDTFEHHGFTIEIVPDDDPESPTEWENDDIFIVAFHRQFSVDRPKFKRPEDVEDWQDDYEVFPLFAYIHSGVALSMSRDGYPFNDRWDSGQVGYVLVRKDGGFEDIEKAAQSLVEEWNTYLSGDVWGYRILDEDGDEVDSCWGFYGRGHCEEAAKEAAQAEAA